MIRWILLVGLAFFTFSIACSASARTHSKLAPVKILFLTGGCCHDWDGLAPILVNILCETGDFQVRLTNDRNALCKPEIDQYKVVVLYSQGGDVIPSQIQGLTEFVKHGGGFVGLHSATATFKPSVQYWQMIGGKFVGHHPKHEFLVECTDPSHPITRLFKSMKVFDEDYTHKFRADSSIHVLAKRDSNQPAIWVRGYGRGRVYINALGHDRDTWSTRDFHTLNLRAIYWAAKLNIPDESSVIWRFGMPGHTGSSNHGEKR